MPGDPLFDTLFRPTVATPAIASAAPVTTRGTRSRAGNAMNRTRAAILDGARRAVEISGTRITMAQVAAAAGVAKATLYNHFRTREAVLTALLEDEVATMLEATAGRPLAEALSICANAIAEHPLLRALSRVEPATVTTLARVDPSTPGWRAAADGLDAAHGVRLGRAGSLILRWLSSYMVSPASGAEIAAELDLLLSALPPAGSPSSTPSPTRAAMDSTPVRAESA